MKTVREILNNKGSKVYSISPDATVYDALKLMADKEIGALIVCQDKNLVGILSERDYARKVVLRGKISKETLVSEIMSENVLYVTPKQSVEECMALLTNKRIRHLPVYDNDELAGIISIGDVVKAVIDENEFVIDQLVHYIKGMPTINQDYDKQDTGNLAIPPVELRVTKS